MTAVLGISAYYHDSAAALIVDGTIAAAAQEERFSRIRQDAGFPTQAIAYCLREAGLDLRDVSCLAYYEKPLRKFERLLETYLEFAPAGFASFRRAMSVWLPGKLNLRRTLRRELAIGRHPPIVFTEHHCAHAASAFYPSPFEEAAILTMDGAGEWATAAMGVGRGNTVALTSEQHFPHSLGLLYSAVTAYCGFEVNGGEYKLMGLAAHGEPTFVATILDHLIDLRPDGSLRIDLQYFDFAVGHRMTSHRFHRLFGGPPREPQAPIEQRHSDLAASIQQVTEIAVMNAARHLHHRTGLPNLCLAGGVALNGVANGWLLREGPFERIWIQPAAGDAGGAIGAAMFAWHRLRGEPRRVRQPDAQSGSRLGPAWSRQSVMATLDAVGAVYTVIEDEAELCRQVAQAISQGLIVGWFEGRMEFGPRALGGRSLLADPRDTAIAERLNRDVKRREAFRPFAPIVLAEHADDWFDGLRGREAPYMQFVLPVRRDGIPAVTHVDRSARVQTVDQHRAPKLHKLLEAFHQQTGCPLLLNTSFNVRDEPIVCTPADAWRCFRTTEIDLLVLEHCIVRRADQPTIAADATAPPR
ncbi:MAG: carbamoyltransferase N-terminal domain-containing protein [Planctomycetaceae bacterium]